MGRVRILPLLLLLFAALLLCPLAALGADSTQARGAAAVRTAANSAVQIPWRDYLIGVVAAGMSPLYHTEALKAQAVAAYSYALATGENSAAPEDAARRQTYWDAAVRQAHWGAQCAENEAKVAAAVDAVLGQRLLFDGAPALTVYHARSCGVTLSAQSVWGKACPYLISVPSPGDKLSPAFRQVYEFEPSALAQAVAPLDVSCAGEAADWITDVETEDSGFVRSVTVCGKTLTGAQLRDALGLPSACFTVEEGFVFTVLGSGHGVGMSQYGADYMARQGSDYRAILAHYYPGTVLESN